MQRKERSLNEKRGNFFDEYVLWVDKRMHKAHKEYYEEYKRSLTYWFIM